MNSQLLQRLTRLGSAHRVGATRQTWVQRDRRFIEIIARWCSQWVAQILSRFTDEHRRVTALKSLRSSAWRSRRTGQNWRTDWKRPGFFWSIWRVVIFRCLFVFAVQLWPIAETNIALKRASGWTSQSRRRDPLTADRCGICSVLSR